MSINRINLPEVNRLEDYLKEHGSHEFFRRYIKKTEAMIGPSTSHAFINDFIKFYKEGDSNTFYIIPQLKLF
jgi:hypothetical protein